MNDGLQILYTAEATTIGVDATTLEANAAMKSPCDLSIKHCSPASLTILLDSRQQTEWVGAR